jgi:hypothetical protein
MPYSRGDVYQCFKTFCHLASAMIMNTVNYSKTTLLLVCMTPYTKRQQTSKSWRQRTECEGPFRAGFCRRLTLVSLGI